MSAPDDRHPLDPGRSRRRSSPPAWTRSRPRSAPGPTLVPEVGIVLGSGLGGLADELEDPVAIPFDELPGLAGGHRARPRRAAAAGPARRPARRHAPGPLPPVRGQRPGPRRPAGPAVPALGARLVVLTNAAGGIDPAFGPGTLMVMRDHLNLTGRTPLLGPNADELGPRFPGPDRRLEPELPGRASTRPAPPRASTLEEGIYVGLPGPQYETPAEVRMLAGLGGHAVGMSTVLECIAARWAGLEVCGVSLVTNAGAGYTGEPLTHEEVLAAGAGRARGWRGSSAASSRTSASTTRRPADGGPSEDPACPGRHHRDRRRRDRQRCQQPTARRRWRGRRDPSSGRPGHHGRPRGPLRLAPLLPDGECRRHRRREPAGAHRDPRRRAGLERRRRRRIAPARRRPSDTRWTSSSPNRAGP